MRRPTTTSSLNEAQARYVVIDPALRHAGWNLDDRTQVGIEIPVDGYDAEPWNGVTDYCLYAPAGEVIAVVEAKRCSRNPREADEQLRHYVTEIAKRHSYAPFGFMTNGHQIWFWEAFAANKRRAKRDSLRQAGHLCQSLLHRVFAPAPLREGTCQ